MSVDTKIGNLFIYLDHTIIRVYGFAYDPSLIPILPSPRIFLLEYIRKEFLFDQIHFLKFKNPITFKLPKEEGPFIVNTRNSLSPSGTDVEAILSILRGKVDLLYSAC